MAETNDLTVESSQFSPAEVDQLGRFFDLLVDLEIIDLPAKSLGSVLVDAIAADDSLAAPEPDLPVQLADAPLVAPEPDLPVQLEFGAALWADSTEADSTEIVAIAPPALEPPEDAVMALDLLRGLVLGAEMSEVPQKLSQLEQQIYQPNELKNLLLPLVAELLRQTVIDSQEDVVQAIAPIIDQVIQSRMDHDRALMGLALAPAIPGAITEQIRISPEELSTAISPVIGKAIQKQIVIEQNTIVDALYPIIGGTISKYMVETIRAINQQVEEALSPAGIKRKIRAKLQGVSEAELILREAAPFTVQAVFLIHKGSGLVISEIQRTDSQRLESDMIAGMLTAICSFANDCISQAGAVSELDSIDYGMSKIILEVAGHCYLAIVIQGEPTKQFIEEIRQTLRSLVTNHSTVFETFNGDPDSVPSAVNTILESLRNSSAPDEKSSENRPSPLVLIGLGVCSLIAIPWGFLQYRGHVNHQAEVTTTAALLSAPELAVYRLMVEAHSGKLKLTGQVPNLELRQKAEHLATIAAPKNWSIENDILAVEIPPDPVLTAAEVQRVTTLFNRMEGAAIVTRYTEAQISVEGSVLRLADAKTITQGFQRIPGVKAVFSTVQVQPLKIDSRLYFPTGSALLNAEDLNSKLQSVKSFLDLHSQTPLKIIGYGSASNRPIADQKLALERAIAVRTALIELGVAPDRLQVSGAGGLPPGIEPTQPDWLSRCVVFEVIPPKPGSNPSNKER